MSGDIFGYLEIDGMGQICTGIQWVEVKNVSKHLTVHRIISHSEELACPKCQKC